MIPLLLLAQSWTDVAWEPNDGWSVRDGHIERVSKSGTLWSKESYGDFALRLEFKLPVGGNSGLLFRGRNNVEHQIELLGNAGGPLSTGCTGAIFRRHAPTANPSRKPGEWNEMELEVRGRAVTLTFNGVVVHERAVVDDLPCRGPIGLQEHGTPLGFRNVRIRRLGEDRPSAPPPLTAEETRAFMKSLEGTAAAPDEADDDPFRAVRAAFTGMRRAVVPEARLLPEAGRALKRLRAQPGLWEPRLAPGEILVRVLPDDRHYTINARPESGATEPIVLGPAAVQLLAHRDVLLVAGRTAGERLEIRVSGDGGHADTTLHRERRWAAVNQEGAPLRLSAHVERTDDGFAFELALPFANAPDQRPWAEAAEHARYAVSVGEARRTIVLATAEADVEATLRRGLGSGLAAGKSAADRAEAPHLLAAAALWLDLLSR